MDAGEVMGTQESEAPPAAESPADAALSQEADAIPLPGDAAPPLGEQASAPGELRAGDLDEASAARVADMYRSSVGLMVNGVADNVLPNWNLTADERTGLTDAISLAAAHWFPDGYIPPKWVALFGALYVGYNIAAARRNPDGTWKPRAIVRVKRDSVAAESELPTGKPAAGKGSGAGGEV